MPHAITIITGPTATGKSACAVRLAQERDAEIVSADSQQVYRECAIGTGQVPLAERGGVPHHLIAVMAPDAPFDLFRYITLADAAIADIIARGKSVIVVGGTGLYIKGLLYGICDAPPRDAAIRAALHTQLATHGSAALHAELERVDPELALKIHPQHSTRVIRALEVFRITGQSLATFHETHRCSVPRYDANIIGLTCPRETLRTRIATRITAQLAAGWCEEIRRLFTNYGHELAIFRAIGYRELLPLVQAGCTDAATITLARDHIITATMQYAKRQMTYARKMPNIAWQPPHATL